MIIEIKQTDFGLGLATMRQENGTGDSVRVLLKAMAVLDLLADSREPLGLGEIATKLNLNKSTCHRILNTLAIGQFVEHSAPGEYRLGIGAFRVGSAMARNIDVRERSLPAMRALQQKTRETIFLCIAHGYEAVCIERLDGHYASTHFLRLGGSLPLHIGAGPRVLLASMEDNEIDEYLGLPLSRNTPRTLRTRSEVWAEVRRIRAEGHAVSNDDVVIGVKAFGAPILDHTNRVVAALSLSAMSASIPENSEGDVLRAVSSAAAEASFAMGFRLPAV